MASEYNETLGLLHQRGQQGTGSFQSWHVNEYEVKGDSTRITTLPNICEGSLGLFPRLDVMPGSASAINDGEHLGEWSQYILPRGNMVSNKDIDYELNHGALQGYKTGVGGDNAYAPIRKLPKEFSLRNRETMEDVPNDAIDHKIAEARFGWHAVDQHTLGLQKQLNFNHNRGFMGIDESGRRRGLEQYWNPAMYPENARTIPADSATALPVDSPDEIVLNGQAINPEDTAAHGVVG
jgi:hypothetical protein